MAEYDKHFFKETIWRYWKDDDYKDLDDNEKFEKLYCYVLELEERIEQLERESQAPREPEESLSASEES